MSGANSLTPDLCSVCGLPHEGLTGYNHPFSRRTSKEEPPPFTVERYGSFGAAIMAENRCLRAALERAHAVIRKCVTAGVLRHDLNQFLTDEAEYLGSPDETSGGWRPIETAPKDYRTRIIVARFEGAHCYWVHDVRWVSQSWHYETASKTRVCVLPTHWMPLSAPC